MSIKLRKAIACANGSWMNVSVAQNIGHGRCRFGPRTLVAEQPVHVPNVHQVLLVLARDADRVLPLVHELEDLLHRGRRERRRPFGEAPDELVEELFRADLEVEGVAAVLDEDVEQLGESMLGVSLQQDVADSCERSHEGPASRHGCCGG